LYKELRSLLCASLYALNTNKNPAPYGCYLLRVTL